MHQDSSLFGDGPYPTTGPLAILARAAFLAALGAIVAAVFLPPEMVPDFVRSTYLQHFAAFYVAGLAGMAAMVRTRLRTVAVWFFVFVSLLEASRMFVGGHPRALINNWVADLGGLAAAFAPVVVERFRQRFKRA